jgi:hypothetical protein
MLQFGPRRLWDEVHAAYHWWDEIGRSRAGQWQFTITPDGQHVELFGTTRHNHAPTVTKDHNGDCAPGPPRIVGASTRRAPWDVMRSESPAQYPLLIRLRLPGG